MTGLRIVCCMAFVLSMASHAWEPNAIDLDVAVKFGDKKLAKVDSPLSFGLWQLTKPVDLKLEKGIQTIRVETPTTEHKRGIAVRWFELKSKGN
jgi:hypothetical protein